LGIKRKHPDEESSVKPSKKMLLDFSEAKGADGDFVQGTREVSEIVEESKIPNEESKPEAENDYGSIVSGLIDFLIEQAVETSHPRDEAGQATEHVSENQDSEVVDTSPPDQVILGETTSYGVTDCITEGETEGTVDRVTSCVPVGTPDGVIDIVNDIVNSCIINCTKESAIDNVTDCTTIDVPDSVMGMIHDVVNSCVKDCVTDCITGSAAEGAPNCSTIDMFDGVTDSINAIVTNCDKDHTTNCITNNVTEDGFFECAIAGETGCVTDGITNDITAKEEKLLKRSVEGIDDESVLDSNKEEPSESVAFEDSTEVIKKIIDDIVNEVIAVSML
jgi:hypothetical protein